jgi:hypothetical protein
LIRLPTADDLGQYQGFTLYETEIAGDDGSRGGPGPGPVLTVGEVRDRAQVFVNRAPAGLLARDHHDTALALPAVSVAGGRTRLEILVEDQGRVDYGPRTGEPKGLIGPVTCRGRPVTFRRTCSCPPRAGARPRYPGGRQRARHPRTPRRPRDRVVHARSRSRPHGAVTQPAARKRVRV